jgi:hypothetical protein
MMSNKADLLERFRRGPDIIEAAILPVKGAELDYKPGPDRWSVREIAAHMADSEMVSGMRFRQVIAEENPIIRAYHQDAWAARLGYQKRDPAVSLETFRRVRMDTYELLKDLPDEAYTRRGNHSEHGEITLLDLLQIYAEHPEGHVHQVAGVREAYRSVQNK